MTLPTQNSSQSSSRREFLKNAAGAGATVAALLSSVPNVHAAGSDTLGVGLIGCGGRGCGAAEQCVHAGPGVKLIALGDLFKDRLDSARGSFAKSLSPDKFDVPSDHCFVGFDAYQKVIDCKGVDVVLLASPPGFRPSHIQAAVAAGKHIFAEKPVAVDAPGVRAVLKACAQAKEKNLSVVSGLCWRYDTGMRETFQRIHDGAVGEIVALQCVYNAGALWHKPRKPGWTDMEWQARNWLYFTWLSGDHNVEQHVHSIDKMAWAMKDQYPVKAVGLGGRQVRTGPEFGHIFDHHSVVYEYASGLKVFSSCRQQPHCANEVNDFIFGTKGTCNVMKYSVKGENSWSYKNTRNGGGDMYQQEHNELIASIRSGRPINNGDYMSKSTLMAVMGRMATYTGQVITWDMAMNSKENLMPEKLEFGPLPVPPVAKPGVTKYL